MKSGKKARGCSLIIVSILIFSFGIGFFIFFLMQKIKDLTEDMVRIPMPESVRVTLEKQGTYTVFYEYKSIYDGKKIYSMTSSSNLELEIKEKETGKDIQLRRPTTNKRYSFQNRAGYGIYDFNIQKPGEYIFSGKLVSGKDERVILAIGHGFTEKIMKIVISGLVVMFITIILGIATLVYGIIILVKKPKPNQEEIYKTG